MSKIMNNIDKVLSLAKQLPSGLNDDKAAEKLLAEYEELIDALAEDDYVGALTEAADAAYYTIKHLQYVAITLNITVDQVIELAVAKYTLRARPGNPKNDAQERVACQELIQKGIK